MYITTDEPISAWCVYRIKIKDKDKAIEWNYNGRRSTTIDKVKLWSTMVLNAIVITSIVLYFVLFFEPVKSLRGSV